MKSVKENLERLISLDKNEYDVTIKTINPKVTDEDLEPMFPIGWNNDSRWPDFDSETNAERWAKWEPYQLLIDYELERMVGCYDTDDDYC
jgi:hypothetical protein